MVATSGRKGSTRTKTYILGAESGLLCCLPYIAAPAWRLLGGLSVPTIQTRKGHIDFPHRFLPDHGGSTPQWYQRDTISGTFFFLQGLLFSLARDTGMKASRALLVTLKHAITGASHLYFTVSCCQTMMPSGFGVNNLARPIRDVHYLLPQSVRRTSVT